MKVYFAGSIRGGRQDAEIYQELISFIAESAEVLTEHVGAETISAMGEENLNDQQIYERDMNWLQESDAIIAEVTTPSLGVGYEISQAETRGMPIFCLFNDKKDCQISAMLSGNPSLKIAYYSDISEAQAAIKKFLTQHQKQAGR